MVSVSSRFLHSCAPLCADDLLGDLENGPLAAGSWFCSRRHCVVDFSDQPDAFVNLNHPGDLEPTPTDP